MNILDLLITTENATTSNIKEIILEDDFLGKTYVRRFGPYPVV